MTLKEQYCNNPERAKDCNLQIEITPEDNHYVILFKKKKYDNK